MHRQAWARQGLNLGPRTGKRPLSRLCFLPLLLASPLRLPSQRLPLVVLLRRRPLLLQVLRAPKTRHLEQSQPPGGLGLIMAGPYRGVHRIISFQRIH